MPKTEKDKNTNTEALSLVKKIESEFPEDQFNRVFPSVTVFNSIYPFHTVSVEVIPISPDPIDGDVFYLGKEKVADDYVKKYSPTKVMLDKIGNTAGIEWDPIHTMLQKEHTTPRRVVFRAFGYIVRPDGSKYPLEGTKEIDLDAIEDEQIFKLEDLARNGKLTIGYGNDNEILKFGSEKCTEEIKLRVRKFIIQVNKHKVALAESGAKNRAIRSIGLKSTFTAEQLKKPFAVPRYHIDVQQIMDDPKAKDAILRNTLGIDTKFFSTPSEIIEAESSEISKTAKDNKSDESTEPIALEEDLSQEEINERKRPELIDHYTEMNPQKRWEAIEKLALSRILKDTAGKIIVLDKSSFLKKSEELQVKNVIWVSEQSVKGDLPY